MRQAGPAPLPQPLARVAIGAVLLLITAAIICGGSARADVAALLPFRIVALVVLAIGLAIPGKTALWRAPPILLLSLLAALMLLQLLPLPPELWRKLPGHQLAASVAETTGLADSWRPMTLAPALTLDSLLSLLSPAAMLVCLYRLSPSQRLFLLPAITCVALVSALVGVWQLAGDGSKTRYLYDFAHFGWPTGVFGNRNHQAALLASGLPMIAAWATLPDIDKRQHPLRSIFCLATALLCIGMIVAAGSRAGLLLGAIAIAGSLAVIARGTRGNIGQRPRLVAGLIVAGAVIAVVAAVALSGRGAAFARVASVDLAQEQRITNAPIVIAIIWDFFPIGSGFGSFDPVFRSHEPDAALQRTYYNHAHNDALELALTGGLPAVILLLAFAGWLGRRFWEIPGQSYPAVGRAAALAIILILIASITDYPLRTPLIALMFSAFCSLLDFDKVTAVRKN